MTNRTLKVCALVDKGGTMGISPDEEYDKMKKDIQELVFPEIDIIFEKDITPDDLIHKDWDIYIFDYGGAMTSYGNEDYQIDNYYKPLIRRIKGHQDKLFVIWSSYTDTWYRMLIQKESPELITPNVITMDWRDSDITRARTFFNLPPEVSSEDFFKRLGIQSKLKSPHNLNDVGNF